MAGEMDENGTLFILSADTSLECLCSGKSKPKPSSNPKPNPLDLQHDDYSPLYAWFNYIVIIIALPSLSVFGVLTNIVNVFIYSRKRSIHIYFIW